MARKEHWSVARIKSHDRCLPLGMKHSYLGKYSAHHAMLWLVPWMAIKCRWDITLHWFAMRDDVTMRDEEVCSLMCHFGSIVVLVLSIFGSQILYVHHDGTDWAGFHQRREQYSIVISTTFCVLKPNSGVDYRTWLTWGLRRVMLCSLRYCFTACWLRLKGFAIFSCRYTWILMEPLKNCVVFVVCCFWGFFHHVQLCHSWYQFQCFSMDQVLHPEWLLILKVDQPTKYKMQTASLAPLWVCQSRHGIVWREICSSSKKWKFVLITKLELILDSRNTLDADIEKSSRNMCHNMWFSPVAFKCYPCLTAKTAEDSHSVVMQFETCFSSRDEK